ncbi:UNVERIFIED_CONTAM: hypothetical protein Sradi_1965100 [Sesamum radiatum]|uniref:Uncharacterized protein n=1 Tax=Sesamum radiatum TaxID=300843 RepID=A0AAW2TEF7_SESRA
MSTLKSDSGGNSSESVDGSYSFFRDHKPCKGNSSTLGVGRDAKWWLDHQGLGRGYHDQVNVLDAEVRLLGSSFVDRNAKASGVYLLSEECYTPKDHGGFSHMPLKHFYSHGKNNGESWLQEFESTIKDDLLSDADLIDLDSCTCLLLERPKKLSLDMDSDWIGLKKIEPWWHATDKDDLASLVSQTSSGHIRNHDHPGIDSMHSEKVADKCVNCFDQFKGQFRNKERKLLHVAGSTKANLASVEDTEFSYMADCTEGNLDSLSMDKSLGKQGSMERILQESGGAFSCTCYTFSSRDSCNTAKVDSSHSQKPRSGDLSRTELLEALCHSQTRAREAEKLAQEACDEKDHEQRSAQFFTPPAIRSKTMTLRRNRNRGPKKKLGKHRCHINKYAIAFAVGLSLAGAGFLVGWTIAWLFPAF